MDTIDDEVCRWQGYDARTLENYLRRYRKLVSVAWRGFPLTLATIAHPRGDLLGCYRFQPRSTTESAFVIELGWWLGPRGRGRGLGTESLPLALVYAHDSLLAATVVMGTSVDNVRAIRQIEAAGATLARTAPHTTPDGSLRDSVWYEHVQAIAARKAD